VRARAATTERRDSIMFKLAILVASLALAATSCGGSADITILNNTSRYVSGDVKGTSYGVVSGGQTKRTIDVGGTLSSSSDVNIRADLHASIDALSPVVATKNSSMKMETGQSYSWEVYFASPNQPGLRLVTISNPHSIVAP
jgi:hypothetical protein